MKKSFSMLLSAASMCFLGSLAACGDDSSSSPSKAEECANGISAECLEGQWDMIGVENKGNGEILPTFDYTMAPGKLIFEKSGHFVFTAPSKALLASNRDCLSGISGSWSIVGANLQIDAFTACLQKTKITVTPTIAVNGAEVKMSFGSLLFLENETDELSIKNMASEVYTTK